MPEIGTLHLTILYHFHRNLRDTPENLLLLEKVTVSNTQDQRYMFGLVFSFANKYTKAKTSDVDALKSDFAFKHYKNTLSFQFVCIFLFTYKGNYVEKMSNYRQ